MTMEDWAKRLDSFVRFAELEILHDSGTVSMEMAKHHAESEFEKYRIMQDRLFDSDFDRFLGEVSEGDKHPLCSKHSVSSGYKIQPAKETDIPLLNAIEAAAATIFPPGSLPENVLAERVPADILTDALHQNRLLVAVDATQAPVGYAFWQNVTGFALFAQVDVHPQHGRKGLGTALVTRMIDQVVQAGFPYLYLTTFSDVPWNAPFYQKLGFILLDADSQPDFIKESLRDEQERGMNNRVAMRYTIQA